MAGMAEGDSWTRLGKAQAVALINSAQSYSPRIFCIMLWASSLFKESSDDLKSEAVGLSSG